MSVRDDAQDLIARSGAPRQLEDPATLARVAQLFAVARPGDGKTTKRRRGNAGSNRAVA